MVLNVIIKIAKDFITDHWIEMKILFGIGLNWLGFIILNIDTWDDYLKWFASAVTSVTGVIYTVVKLYDYTRSLKTRREKELTDLEKEKWELRVLKDQHAQDKEANKDNPKED